MKKSKQNLLWRIQSPHAISDSFLFGTIHLHLPGSKEYLFSLQDLINSCDIFCSEMDLSFSHHRLTSEKLFLLADQKSLQQLIGIKRYQKACEILKKAFGFHLENYRHYKPLIICQSLAENALGVSSSNNLDHMLWKMAAKNGLVCKGLESVEEQIQILNQIPLEYQLKSFLSIVSNVKKFKKQNENLLQHYKDQQIDAIYKSGKSSLGKMRRLLLYDRNIIMAERIASWSSKASHFYAVGAGHLAGKFGLIRFLKLKGFKMTPFGSWFLPGG